MTQTDKRIEGLNHPITMEVSESLTTDVLTEEAPGSNSTPSCDSYQAFASINKARTSIRNYLLMPVFYTLRPGKRRIMF